MERFIIHLNVADFAVAVERAMDCRLKGRPVIIAPEGAGRSAVYDMSEEAYRGGVRKGMPLDKAVRRCRGSRVLPPHPDRYERAMYALFNQALPYSPIVESGDRDGHLFMDITGTRRLFGPPVDIAWRLRKQIQKTLCLEPIWSVAPNKLVAKVATRLVKPIGEYRVEAGDEAAFLAPLPVDLLPGINRADLQRLREFNLTRVFQVAAMTREHLEVPFGSRAQFIYETVRGIDRSPVLPVGEKPPAVAVAHTFAEDTNDVRILERTLYGLIESAGRTLRRRRLAPRRIGMVLDYSDGVRHVCRAAMAPAFPQDRMLFKPAQTLLVRALTRRVRIRHLRVVFDKLVFPTAQRELFSDSRAETEKHTRLAAVLDAIRNRFGHKAIQMGRC